MRLGWMLMVSSSVQELLLETCGRQKFDDVKKIFGLQSFNNCDLDVVSYWICHLMMRLLSKLIKLKSATICFVYCSLTVWIRVIRFILFYFLVVLFRLCPIALVARLLWPTLKQIKIIRSTIWLSFSTFVVELPLELVCISTLRKSSPPIAANLQIPIVIYLFFISNI